ncbi:hypothetical protein [Clostridium aceticum]|nr:hypothetical protein [Clostridium aceticum]
MRLVHDYLKNIIKDNADKCFWIERVIEETEDALEFKERIVYQVKRNSSF